MSWYDSMVTDQNLIQLSRPLSSCAISSVIYSCIFKNIDTLHETMIKSWEIAIKNPYNNIIVTCGKKMYDKNAENRIIIITFNVPILKQMTKYLTRYWCGSKNRSDVTCVMKGAEEGSLLLSPKKKCVIGRRHKTLLCFFIDDQYLR